MGLIGNGYNHASDALYNNRSLLGESGLDFKEAMDLVIAQCNHEKGRAPTPGADAWDQQAYDSLVNSLAALQGATQKALDIYTRLENEGLDEDRLQAVASNEMQQQDDELLYSIGEALAWNDYSRLAI